MYFKNISWYMISVDNFEFHTNNWLWFFLKRKCCVLYAPSTNQLCQYCESQYSFFDLESTENEKNNRCSYNELHWMECLHRWSCAKCTQIQYCFAIYLVLCISCFLACFAYIHIARDMWAQREREPVCRQLLLSNAAGHPPHRL